MFLVGLALLLCLAVARNDGRTPCVTLLDSAILICDIGRWATEVLILGTVRLHGLPETASSYISPWVCWFNVCSLRRLIRGMGSMGSHTSKTKPPGAAPVDDDSGLTTTEEQNFQLNNVLRETSQASNTFVGTEPVSQREVRPQKIKQALTWIEECDELLEAAQPLRSINFNPENYNKLESIRAVQDELLILLGQARAARLKQHVLPMDRNTTSLLRAHRRAQSDASALQSVQLEVSTTSQEKHGSRECPAVAHLRLADVLFPLPGPSAAANTLSLSLARLRSAMEELQAPTTKNPTPPSCV